ncbi:hypothetical protein FB471_3957 [Amycolatopsis cihanbeyliensis]|uniref:4-amino-4-deoxy-L-arabinose transferase-like glycosyltransferase n=1 Tax=Amycolatopsis cihanbeyliensis TaxID=1128664 RepID=A0A542DMG7_AMYCI|nr:hypothetical protein FB471_3957 [Amycolatopsis cihanbeyliensis]
MVALFSTAAFLVVRTHLIDDTYITLAYAENLAFHGHWGLIDEGTSNTATSPLNVLLLAVVTVLVRDAVFAAGVLFVACQVVLLLGLRRLGTSIGLPRWFAPMSVGLLTVNPLLLSSVGLEIALGAAALSWLVVCATERRPAALGAVAGLLALIRLDLLVFVVVIVLARRRFWVGALRSLAAFAAVALPWFLFSWFVLGSAVPDTLIIKTLQRSWGEWSFSTGVELYLRRYPQATLLSFLPALAGGVLGLPWLIGVLRGAAKARSLLPFAALAVGGVLHYAAYMWLDVPPYHWYYGPSIIAATVFLVAMSARWTPHLGLAAPAVLTAASVAVYAAPGLPRDFPPMTTNHASSQRYLEIGTQIGRIVPGATVHSAGEVGALAYACSCALVDLFSDRGAVGPAITEREDRSGPIGRALLEVNFEFLDRGVRPAHPEFVLETTPVAAPPRALASWTITSPWVGTRQLYLVRAVDARAPNAQW